MMIGFIGGGNMAEAIVNGLKDKNIKIIISDKKEERLNYLGKNYNVITTKDNKKVCYEADLIIIAVKPQNIAEVLKEIKGCINDKHLIVSIVAGIRLSYISNILGSKNIVRVMPNTPALIGEGMSVISTEEAISKEKLDKVLDIFKAVGKVVKIEESKMDIVTALSGSGPALFAYFIEAIVEAGVREGITYENALFLTLQTALGTIKMLQNGKDTNELKKMVTSPGGTTAECLYELDKGKLKATVKDALKSAKKRAEELSKV